MQRMLNFLLLLLIAANSWSVTTATIWYNKDPLLQIHVDLFMTTTCPHCQKADAFLQQIEASVPWVRVNRYVINQDKKALVHFEKKLNELGVDDYRVPAIIFCGSKWTGFDAANTTGKKIWEGLKYCHEQIKTDGELTPVTIAVLQRMSPSIVELTDPETASPMLITSSTAVLDALNPCSLFALGLFIGFLLILPTRREKVVLGALMIVLFAVLHYMQQAQIDFYYTLLSWLRWPAVLIGLLLIGLTRLYPKVRNPPLFFLFALLSLVVVYSYQQTCIVKNMSLFYQQWLMSQNFDRTTHMFYQVLYQFFYILPVILIWFFILYFLSGERSIKRRFRLEAIGSLFLLATGVILVIYPESLAASGFSQMVLFPLAILGWFLGDWLRRKGMIK